MSDAVRTYKIKNRRFLLCFLDQFFHFRIFPVGQEDWAGLGIANVHVADAVDFFIFPGIFMLFDNTGLVIVNGCAGHKSSLGPSIHRQLIDIKTGCLILDKFSLFLCL